MLLNRYLKIAKDKMIIGAYLICGNRLWEFKEIPKIVANMTCRYDVYLESIQIVGTGNEIGKSLFEEVVEYLVSMAKDIRYYGIGSTTAPNDAQIKRDITNWVTMSLAEYMSSKLVVENGQFIKQVDWQRVKITNAVVSDLGIYK